MVDYLDEAVSSHERAQSAREAEEARRLARQRQFQSGVTAFLDSFSEDLISEANRVAERLSQVNLVRADRHGVRLRRPFILNRHDRSLNVELRDSEVGVRYSVHPHIASNHVEEWESVFHVQLTEDDQFTFWEGTRSQVIRRIFEPFVRDVLQDDRTS